MQVSTTTYVPVEPAPGVGPSGVDVAARYLRDAEAVTEVGKRRITEMAPYEVLDAADHARRAAELLRTDTSDAPAHVDVEAARVHVENGADELEMLADWMKVYRTTTGYITRDVLEGMLLYADQRFDTALDLLRDA